MELQQPNQIGSSPSADRSSRFLTAHSWGQKPTLESWTWKCFGHAGCGLSEKYCKYRNIETYTRSILNLAASSRNKYKIYIYIINIFNIYLKVVAGRIPLRSCRPNLCQPLLGWWNVRMQLGRQLLWRDEGRASCSSAWSIFFPRISMNPGSWPHI